MQQSLKCNYLLLLFAVFGLSACSEGFHLDMLKVADNDLFSSHAGEAQQKAENNNPQLPVVQNPQRRTSGLIKVDDSVEIFDLEPIAEYTRNKAPQSIGGSNDVEVFSMASAPRASGGNTFSSISDAYGRGRPARDSSVTIYDLEGQPIQSGINFDRDQSRTALSSSGYGNNYAGNSVGRSSSSTGLGTGAANQIFFKHGSSRLGGGDMRKVSTLADEAKFAPVNYISVEGYASRPTQYGSNTTQAHITNLRQSAKRAEKVTRALINKGVPGEKIKTVSWGATKATGRNSYDRRVDVNIGGQ